MTPGVHSPHTKRVQKDTSVFRVVAFSLDEKVNGAKGQVEEQC